jgi:hypothetical protein
MSCAGLSRASTSSFAAKTWMAGTSPAMTRQIYSLSFSGRDIQLTSGIAGSTQPIPARM